MIFEAGIRHIIPYETPFGLLEMVSSTKSIDTIKDNDHIELKVTYHLEVNNTDMGTNVFHMKATRL